MRSTLAVERKFTLEYWIDNSWYVGRIKEVPGVFSQGETLDVLEKNIADAYRLVVSEDEAVHPPSAEIKEKEVIVSI